jgi:hypothetical protein
MNLDPGRLPGSDEVSARWLVKSLAHGILDTLRRNKLATVLAAAVLVGLTVLAVDSRFDGYVHYREFILPRLLRLETGFHNALRSAENSSGDWRAYYFENAHRQVRDILRAARLDRPGAYFARRKHREFIRYYESINLEFYAVAAKVRTNPNVDYLSELKVSIEKLKPIRDRWAEWAIK